MFCTVDAIWVNTLQITVDAKLVRLKLPQRGVHPARRGIAHVGQDVGVCVQGEAYVGVAQEVLNELGVHALLQQ